MMRRQEVIDDVFAVVPAHGVKSGHACEGEWSDELAHGEFDVEVVEFVARLGALQDGVERLSVLVDHPRSERLRMPRVVVAIARCGPQGDPGQGGEVKGCLGEQGCLTGEQFDQLLSQGN